MSHNGVPHAGFVRKQGPEWLVNLLFNPPLWVQIIFYGATALLLGYALVNLYRRGFDLEEDIQLDMMDNAIMIVSIMVLTLAFVFRASYPYYVDVLGGYVGGVSISYAISKAMRTEYARSVAEGWGMNVQERLAFGWLALGAVGFVVPTALMGTGVVPLASRGVFIVLLAAMGLSFYNIVEAQEAKDAKDAAETAQ
jgi:hypothetical protein